MVSLDLSLPTKTSQCSSASPRTSCTPLPSVLPQSDCQTDSFTLFPPTSLVTSHLWPAVLSFKNDSAALLRLLKQNSDFVRRCRREMRRKGCGAEGAGKEDEWEGVTVRLEQIEAPSPTSPPHTTYLTVPARSPSRDKARLRCRHQLFITFPLPASSPSLLSTLTSDDEGVKLYFVAGGAGLPSVVVTDFDALLTPPPSPPPFGGVDQQKAQRAVMKELPFVKVG